MDLLLKRLQAGLIDILICAIPAQLIAWILGFFKIRFIVPWVNSNSLFGDAAMFFLVFYLSYELFFNIAIKVTIGKRITRLRIAYPKGSSAMEAAFRSIVKVLTVVFFYSLGALISVLMMAFFDPSTSLHDKAVDSRVWQK